MVFLYQQVLEWIISDEYDNLSFDRLELNSSPTVFTII